MRAGLAGVAAAAVAVGVAEVVAVLTGPLSAPLLAVGGVVVDNVPPAMKDFGVAVFGVHDKTALITGTAILLAAYAFGLGIVAARWWRAGLAGIGLFAVIGVAAAVTRHDAGVTAALPTLVGAALAVFVLRYLLDLTRPDGADGPVSDEAPTEKAGTAPTAYSYESRRRFLQALGIAGGIALVSGFGGRLLTSRRAVTQARKDVVLPAARQTAPPLPSGVQAQGATPFVSSNKDFYRIDTALYPPQVDPSTWQLKIHGMVRNPITITWEELLQRPMIERYVTLACVSNEVGGDLIGNALWLGTPIKELLDEADPLPGADQVVQRSVDGWTCGSPTAALRDGRDALLAVGMNGVPLPVDHGFPVRMVVPGLYGYVSACKWITEIELARFADFDAYWVPRGWSQQAPIKTESRIDTPRDGAARSPGTVPIAGVAWAQHRGISKVEVQIDDGPWAVAELHETASADTWRQWSYPWQATEGQHILRVRATDTSGQTQTSTPAPPAPDGATGWHSVQVNVG
ncbi:oxidoreductase [Paractinoplanes tereljensis]|uniref:Oxidoreductase n=1 Tax=Paractinoplanes tereljensis TaxID=571912 RepID=A0A919TRM3_9ACTN|nr:oxidoreductase [Actinoplanes tereljensis]